MFWTTLFVIGLPFVLYKAVREPAWSAVAAGYLYFAIPEREFPGLPGVPWQAAFWALAIAGSLRYYKLLGENAADTVAKTGTDVVERALHAVTAELIETISVAAVNNKMAGEIRGAALIATEEKTVLQVQNEAPAALQTSCTRAVRAALHLVVAAGEGEALRVRETINVPTRGALHQFTKEAVTKAVEGAVVASEKTVREAIDAAVKEVDPTKIPIPRGPLAAIVGNTGLWLFFLWMALTYIGGLNAVYDKTKGNEKAMVCILLLIPLCGIMMGLRSAVHFGFFTGAWMLGVFHLAMNGVNYWVTYGGRADSAGGQGGEANFLGGMCSIVVPVALGLTLHAKQGWLKIVTLVMGGAYTLGIIASGSRASLLALIGILGWWVVRTHKRFLALGIAAVAAVGFLIAAPDEFWERMGTTFSKKDDNPWVQAAVEPSKHERLVLWDLAIKGWKTRPITGIGPGNYVNISAEETNFTDPYARQRGLQTHNAWLQILCEYGVIGFALWAGAFAYSIVCLFRARARMVKYPGYEWFCAICLGFEAGMLGCILFLTFNSTHWHDYLYWHFILGPLALQIANDTGAQLDWLKPAEPAPPPPEARYGPPKRAGLDLQIDLSETAPLNAPR
jgi:O-antigen ligase